MSDEEFIVLSRESDGNLIFVRFDEDHADGNFFCWDRSLENVLRSDVTVRSMYGEEFTVMCCRRLDLFWDDEFFYYCPGFRRVM